MPEVKPEIMRWARETAGLSLGRAAGVQVHEERLCTGPDGQ
jgi:hypothetical protein